LRNDLSGDADNNLDIADSRPYQPGGDRKMPAVNPWSGRRCNLSGTRRQSP